MHNAYDFIKHDIGIPCRRLLNSLSAETICRAIDSGKVVMCSASNHCPDHCIIICGYNNKHFMVYDPLFGKQLMIPRQATVKAIDECFTVGY